MKTIVDLPKLPVGFSTTLWSNEDTTTFSILHKEIGYGGMIEQKSVGYFNVETKIARPTHGYFPNHPTGKKLGKFFTSIGYDWDAS